MTVVGQRSLLKAAGTQERAKKHVHAELSLIEEVNFLRDDTAGRRSTVSNN